MPERVKVVHLITLLEFGGAQGNTIHTVLNLDKSRFETYLWSGRGAYWDNHVKGGIPAEHLSFLFFLVRPLNPVFDVLALLELWWKLLKLRPTILHTHSSKAGVLGRIAAYLAGVPIVIHTFHGFGFNDRQRPWTRAYFLLLEKITAPLAQRLIFVSRSNWEEARREGIGRPHQYVLIRSGVPIKKIEETGRFIQREKFFKELGLDPSLRLVTTIGAFKPQKNLGDFIEMADRVSRQFPDVRFMILGDGALRIELEKQVSARSLTGRVYMPGWKENASSYLAVSDLFVMTSLWEGLPRSLVEAMILGVPPVCYETDGVLDLLSPNEGAVVPRGDVDALTNRVCYLLNNKEKHRHLSLIVKGRVGVEFDIDQMVRQQEDLYTTLLKH